MNLLSRGCARLRVCLLVTIAACAVSLLVASSATATSFSVSLGTQQAGSETNQTWLWSSFSATSPASKLSVELTHGYLARTMKMGSECTREVARAAGCPTASRLGSVVTVHSSPGALPVVSRGYIALERRRAGEFNGFDVLVVLDRPSARYRRSVGIGRIEFNTATADPTTVFDLGSPRLEFADGRPSPAQLVTFGFTGRQGWLRNPTRCGSGATISSITEFADGSSETVTRSPRISGCGSLTVDAPLEAAFNPREVSLDKSVPWKATGRIGHHADGERTTDPRTVTMRMMGAPKIGEATAVFTTSCTRAQAEAAACPPQSRLGKFCVESSSAGEVACGDAWNSGVRQPGSAGGGAGGSVGLLLSLTKFSGGSGGGGGGAGGLFWVGDGSVQIVPGTGESILTINDLPQVDIHAFRLSGDNPLFEANNNCGNNPLNTRVTGWSGASRDATGVTAIACSPGIETTDARDDDSDGDGIADKMWRPANFKINFRVSDRGEGVDPSSISCSFKGWDGTIKGSPRVDDSDDDGLDDGCSISSATGGDGVLEIRAADWRGHVTVLKLGYSVDVWLPAVQTVDPIDDDDDGDGLADDEFREPNFSVAFEATDEGSGIDDAATTCGAEDQKGIPLPKVTPKIAKESHGKFRCIVEAADDGPIVIVATVRDVTGHVTVLKRQWTVDSQGPVLMTTETEDEDCGGGTEEVALSCFRQAFFDVFFSATDAGSGVDWITNTCAIRLLGGAVPGASVLQSARIVDLDHDGTPDACRVENAPEGDVEVDISVADHRGHVTVLKSHFTVDTTPPTIAIDEPGVHFAPGAFFDIFTDLGFTIDGLRGHRDVGGYRCAFNLDGDFDSISRPTSNCAPAGELGGPPALPLQPGLNHAQFKVMDPAGNITVSFFDIFYDNVHPEITLDDGRDQDCDDETEDVAPTCYRQAFFDVFFSASDAGIGVNWITNTCAIRMTRGASPDGSSPSATVVDEDGDGQSDSCRIEGASEGEYDVEISVADWRGHVTVLKLHYGVDATPPASEFTDPMDADTNNDSIPDFLYRVSSFDAPLSLTDEGGSGVDPSTSSCEVRLIGGALPGGAVISAAVSMVDTNSDGDVDACRVSDAPAGRLRVEVVVRDRAGNRSDSAPSAIREWIVDNTPPDIAIDEPGVHFALEPFFDVFSEIGFSIDGMRTGDPGLDGYGCDFHLEGDFDSISRPTSNCAPPSEGGQPALPLKPGPNRVEFEVIDPAGNSSMSFFDVFYDTVSPELALTDPPDNDCDATSDDTARCYRPASFDIPFEAVDEGSGVAAVNCTATLADGTSRDLDVHHHGSSQATGHRVSGSCASGDLPDGDTAIELRAVDFRGHVTVLKLNVTVDSTDPAVQFFDPGSEPFIPDPWLHFDVVDANPGSSVCSLVNLDTGEAVGEDDDCDGFTDSAGESCDPADPAAGDCKRTYAFPHVFDQKGRYQATVTHTDKAGNSGTNTMIFRVENDSPTLSLTDPPDNDCDATSDDTARCYRPASFDIPFEAVDEGSGVAAVNCTATLADGTSRDLDVHHHGSSQATGHRVSGSCASGDLPDGDTAIELRAVDFRGHVTVLKLNVTVDSTDPVVQFSGPGSVPFIWNPSADPPTLRFDLDETNPGLSRCEIVSLDGVVLSTETCGDGYTNQAGETCDPADPAAGDCKRTYAFPHVFDQKGRFMARVVHTDRAGNASFDSVQLEVADPDLEPPDIAIDEPGVHFALEPFFDVFSEIGFSIDGMRPGDPGLDPYRCTFSLDGDFESISRPTSNCAPGGPIELPEGLNHVGVTVRDAAGNAADAFFDVFVDLTPPAVSFFDPGSEPFKGWPVLFFAVDDANPGSSVCSLVNLDTGETVGEDEDCDGYADSAGRPCEPDDPIGSDLCKRVFVLPHVLESSGRFRATVVHTDRAGNAGSSSVDFVVTPLADPSIAFEDAPAITNNPRPTIPFTITNGDHEGSTLCEVLPEVDDEVLVGFVWNCGGTWTGSSCDCSATLPNGLPDGNYRLRVTHTPRASGDSTPATHDWTIDTTKPDTTIDSFDGEPVVPGVALYTDNPNPEATFTTSDDATTECALDTDPNGETPAGELSFESCSLSFRVGPNAGGDTPIKKWCFRVLATDAAGNSTDTKLCFTIEPRFVFSSPADTDSDQDGTADDPLRPADFDVVFVVEGDPSGDMARAARCIVRGWDPVNKQPILSVSDTNGDGVPDVCHVEDAPSGKIKIEIGAAGYNSSSDLKFNVDADIPEVEFFGPGSEPFDGSRWPWPAPKPGRFSVTDANPGSSRCQIIDVATGETLDDRDCDDFADSVGEACEPSDPTVTDCERYFGIPQIAQPSGAYLIRVVHTDAVGNEGSAQIEVPATAAGPPEISVQSPTEEQNFFLSTVGSPSTIPVQFSIAGGTSPLHTWCYFDGRSTVGMHFDPCQSGLTKSADSLGGGSHNVTIVTRDADGRQVSRVVRFNVHPFPVNDVCIALYPPPEECLGSGAM